MDGKSVEFDYEDILLITFYKFIENLQKEGLIKDLNEDEIESILKAFTSEDDSIDSFLSETLLSNGFRIREDNRSHSEIFEANLNSVYGYLFYHLDLIYILTGHLANYILDLIPKDHEHPSLTSLMVLQHKKCCSIFSEIIHLLKGGFGTGAMTRFRSLHETTVIMEFIKKHGMDACNAYYDFTVVAKARNITFLISLYGEEPDLVEELTKYQTNTKPTLIDKYGDSFSDENGFNDYIWAKPFLNGRASFNNIRNSVNRVHGKEQYKLSSNNIHSSSISLISTLGSLDKLPIAGASNIGLSEPGVWSVYELTQMNSLLISTTLSEIKDISVLDKTIIIFSNYLILNLAKYVYDNFKEVEREILSSHENTD